MQPWSEAGRHVRAAPNETPRSLNQQTNKLRPTVRGLLHVACISLTARTRYVADSFSPRTSWLERKLHVLLVVLFSQPWQARERRLMADRGCCPCSVFSLRQMWKGGALAGFRKGGAHPFFFRV